MNVEMNMFSYKIRQSLLISCDIYSALRWLLGASLLKQPQKIYTDLDFYDYFERQNIILYQKHTRLNQIF